VIALATDRRCLPSEHLALEECDPLPAEQRAAIEAIIDGRSGTPPPGRPPIRWAWTQRDALIRAGHTPETLAQLEAANLITAWSTPPDARPETERSPADPPCGVVLTLTPRGADRLGVEIVEELVTDRPRWGPLDSGPRYALMPRYRRTCSLEFPEEIVDPAPSPEQYLLDEVSGKPVLLFAGGGGPGVPVVRDRRIKAPKATPPPRRARARAT
jgi:hypothetical protein